MRKQSKIPAVFFAHGTPALLKESGTNLGPGFEGTWNGPHAKFLRELGPYLLKTYTPKAILVISAHWESRNKQTIEIAMNTDEWQSNNLFYDYYGFPDAMYKVAFKSKSDANLVERVSELLAEANIKSERLVNKRGLDHGCFVPFKLMFGDSCDVPIVEISQFSSLKQNLALGEALAKLREEGVLILSGGLTIHTFQDFSAFSPTTARQGYKDYEDVLKAGIVKKDGTDRIKAITEATEHEYFKKAHPTIEHFTPIAVAAAAGKEGTSLLMSSLHGAVTVAFGIQET